MGNYAWTEAEKAYLEANWQCFPTLAEQGRFLNGLARVSGTRRSLKACGIMASKLGFTQGTNQGLITVAELAREMGVSATAVQTQIRKHPKTYPVVRSRKYIYLTEEAEGALRQHYETPPSSVLAGCLTVKEAVTELCTSRSNIYILRDYGILEEVRNGRLVLLTKSSIERAKALRQRHGSWWLHAIREELSEAYAKQQARSRELHRKRKQAA